MREFTTDTEVYLWCGGREPYAKKSHAILKGHIADYEETIFEGCGHGQMMLRETDNYLNQIRMALL